MSPAPQRELLFASVHPPGRVPSQRFRYEQYVEYLDDHGFRTTFAPVLRSSEYPTVYGEGGYLRKAGITARGIVHRIRQARHLDRYDIVFVQREALVLGLDWFERAVVRSSAKLVFDFDDAIWLQNASDANRRLSILKRPSKTADLIRIADLVIAGNEYLADYARQFNPRVEIIPTTIDTDAYVRRGLPSAEGPVCIGWSGSTTTIQHFDLVVPILKRLRERYGEKVRFEVIGDARYREPELGIQGRDWNSETEVSDLSEFHIGVMPLPDDEWARGKCGLKGLQYMALEIPTVMSPVGVNSSIIDDGGNGFLAAGADEWFTKLSALIESPELRRRLGKAGGKTVAERYSVLSQQSRYLDLLDTVADGVHQRRDR